VAPAGESFWVTSLAGQTLDRIDATVSPDSRSGKITVRISGTNDEQQGDRVIKGGVAGIGNFSASGVISDKGKVVVYRTAKPPLITLRFVASGSKGTVTFLVKIDTNFGPPAGRSLPAPAHTRVCTAKASSTRTPTSPSRR